MWKTSNTLKEKTRAKMIDLLAARLADAVDGWTQLKTAHWNIKGSGFIAIHELFDKVAAEFDEYADTLAERAVALGGVVSGTARYAAKHSALAEYPKEIQNQKDHLKAVTELLSAFGKSVREAIDVAADAGDASTADVFTEIARGVDKSLWFVEAHLQ